MAKKDKKKSGGIKKAIRAAGPNISKSEFKSITKAAGGNVAKALNRISSVGANLNSGAANMLIKQSQKAPRFQRPDLGDSKIAQALRGMIGTPAYTAQRNPQSGAPYGGSRAAVPGTGLMIGGTQIRPGGKVAVKKPQAPMAAPAVAAAPAAPAEPTDTGDAFDYDAMFADMMGMMPDYDSMFADLQSQMAGMFEELSSQFDTPDPIQLASLGQAYGGDMIRARQRQRKTRTDYLRNQMNNMALGGLGGGLAPMMIGGGLTL